MTICLCVPARLFSPKDNIDRAEQTVRKLATPRAMHIYFIQNRKATSQRVHPSPFPPPNCRKRINVPNVYWISLNPRFI